jgi:hypothetical protein
MSIYISVINVTPDAKVTEPRRIECRTNPSTILISYGTHEALARILMRKPHHAADCERIISAYNRLKSTFRNSFDRRTIVDYLFIHVNMPALNNFDARPAVLKWFADKSRRKRDTPKSAQQNWFKTIFEVAEPDVETDLDKCNGTKAARTF